MIWMIWIYMDLYGSIRSVRSIRSFSYQVWGPQASASLKDFGTTLLDAFRRIKARFTCLGVKSSNVTVAEMLISS